MNFWQTLRIALRALAVNPMRSFLTVLGVVIGVAAVVAMVAIGEGAKSRIEASFASMGTDMLILSSGSTRSGGARGGAGSMPSLTWDDLNVIRTQVPSVKFAAAQLRASATVASEEQNWTTSVYGTSADFFEIRSWRPQAGVLLSEVDVRTAAKVVVLGSAVAKEVFGEEVDAVGRMVRIKGSPFMVIGVLQPKGQSAMGQDYDDSAYVPQTAFMGKIQGGMQKFVSGQILISAQNGQTARAQAAVSEILRERHKIAAGDEDDFSVRDLAEMASAMAQGTETMSLLLASIAAVSLLVGGIGIMNIMLVSVTERTREIGLRMALGAKPKHVLSQFLVEAIVLSLLGGLIGVLGGVGIGWYLASQFGWPIAIQMDVILLALGFSVLVGVGFGIYPARKASRLTPIDALRYE